MTTLDTSHVIHAQLEIEGCTAELWLNGIPIMRLGPHTMPLESQAVQQFLVAGTNQIELLVEPGPSPARARTEYRDLTLVDARAVGRLYRFEGGTIPDPEFGERLIDVTWRSGESGSTRESFPRSAYGQAELGAVVPRWSYQDAPILSMEESLVDEADAALEEVAEAFRRGSPAQLLAALEEQQREVLLAYPALTADFIRDDLSLLVTDYHRAKEPVLPLRRDRHEFRLVAGGRMIQCVDDDWKPSLRLVDPDEGNEVPYPLFLARIGGRLRVVR
ncbi:hypothetical protein [Polyangium aurulentum]|uniref:hypothetical protein n=1 Tax=Polyangium aurulentum TaxID=2567896 RepID=UPI0010ADDBD9|nr:hypothetical protein [Polyangium aurulentum]UQA62016.1 hypothetical protein E8A73_016690 [Polyangium aurulentum]